MAAEDNIQIINCTTPANYFHVLRRQTFRKFRKPLIIFTPKITKKYKEVVSKYSDMAETTKFNKIIIDVMIRRIKSCKSSFLFEKYFYDIKEKMNNEQANSMLIIRLEQLYPFPSEILEEAIKNFKHASFIWCQEEPKNMGAWPFYNPFLIELLYNAKVENQMIKYVGRKESASTATGLFKKHVEGAK